MKSLKIQFKAGRQEEIIALVTYLKKLTIVESIEEVEENGAETGSNPMVMDVFLERIAEAEKNILEGKTFNTSQVREMMKSWK